MYELKHRLGICESDLEFAVSLFAKSLKIRYNWLNKRVNKIIESIGISGEEREDLLEILERLEGYK